MYFPENDDETEIGPSSLVDNDTQQLAEGNTFLGNLRKIWRAIERALDVINDPFAGDDISEDEADNAYQTITDEYARLLAERYDCGDENKDCWTPTQPARPRDATYTGESQLTSSPFGSPGNSQLDVLSEEDAIPLTPLTYYQRNPLTQSQSLLSSYSDSPPTGTIGLTASGYSTPPPGYKLDSGLTRGTGASKSIIAKAFEEESRDDKVVLQTVATSILSGLFREEKIDVKKALAEGDASKVYKLIAKILFKQKVAIDTRHGATRGKGNEWQMKEVWGSYITDFAKSADAICYLCGGRIVPSYPGGGQPEMEHKLPCAVFYARFAFIYSCFANELTAWRTYVANLDDNSRLMEYYTLMNSSVGAFNKVELDSIYKTISEEFLRSIDRSSLDEGNLRLFTYFILPAYLSEFAYSHSLCNRLKSNHDLSKGDILTKYYKGLQAILNGRNGKCNKDASKGILKPACIDEDVCNAERNAILAGLKDKISFRKTNVQAQMTYLAFFASEYAKESKTTEKRMILHTIKETIQNIPVPTSSGKVTKKEIKQMNVQARIIAQVISKSTIDASIFLDQLKKDNITGTQESERLQNKARDRVNIYLDRIHQIFENVYDTPDNIKRQLKNAYVLPAIKLRIYNNTNAYYNVLNSILDNINEKIDKLRIKRVSLGENKEMLGECESFVSNLNRDIIEKYAEKIAEWQKPTGVATTYVAAENARNTAGVKRRRPVNSNPTYDEAQILEADKEEARKQKAIQQNRERVERARTKDKFDGGRIRQVRKTRKLKRGPRKTIKRGGQRKRTIKHKYRSRKNTRRH